MIVDGDHVLGFLSAQLCHLSVSVNVCVCVCVCERERERGNSEIHIQELFE